MAFARCVRITRDESPQQLNPQFLSDPHEIALHRASGSAVSSLCFADNVDQFPARV